MAYAGTEGGVHVFMVHMKAVPEGAVYRLALSDTQCRVYDARPIAGEYSRYGTSFRHAQDRKGRCYVFGDSATARFWKLWGSGEHPAGDWDALWGKAIGDPESG